MVFKCNGRAIRTKMSKKTPWGVVIARKKNLKNTIIVGSREDKEQDNFRGDWVLNTVSYGAVTMPGGLI